MWQLRLLILSLVISLTALALTVYQLIRVLPVEKGGTGSTTPITARATLGVVGNTDIIPVSQGGTGASTTTTARATLGVVGTTDVIPVSQGGTGASTATEAREALAVVGTTDIIPVSQGGTGASTVTQAKQTLNIVGSEDIINATTGVHSYSGIVELSLEGSGEGYVNAVGGTTTGYELIAANSELREILFHPLPGAGYLRNFFVRHVSLVNGLDPAGMDIRLEAGPNTSAMEVNPAFVLSHTGTVEPANPVMYDTGDATWSVPAGTLVGVYLDPVGLSATFQLRFGYEFVPAA